MSQAEHLILEALQASVSQDPALLKEAERRFEGWLLEPGFYAVLMRVLCNRSLQHDVRLMAVTQIKNGVDLYWRRNMANRVPSEEKVLIRGLLLENLDEPSEQITRQLGELLARIARSDCPHDWPELLPTLTENVQGGSSLLRWRSLFFLYRVMKTLSSKRLQKDRETFYELTSKLFLFLVGLWKGYRDNVSRHLEGGFEAGQVQAACQTLEQARTCLKVLRLMVVHGVLRFNTVLEPLTFVSETFDQVRVFADMRLQVQQCPQLEEVVEKTISIHMKTLIDVQSHHPINYVPFIKPALELVAQFLFTDDGSSKLFERFALKLLTLIRLILRCEEYKPPYSERLVEVTPPPQVLQAIQLKKAFFSADLLSDISRKMVTHYLVLREEELQMWHSDPEEFLKEEAEANLEFSVHECVQVVLLTLLNEYRLSVAPVLYSLVEAFQNTGPSADERSLLVKEAVYKVAGLAAHDLYDVIDFDSWYSGHLLQELEIREPRYQLVRTRVVWMLGCWVGVKMSPELFPSLYKVLVTLLDPQELLIMRVNAAESLRHAVDDLNFDSEAFSPFLPDTMVRLQHLLGSVREGRTKMIVIGVITSIVERVDRAVQPHVGSLVQQLPDLWREGGGEDLVQGAIIDMLQMLVRSLGSLSVQLHHILLPIVDMATDVKQVYHVNLGEAALELWEEVMHHATTMTPDLMTLFRNMGGVLGVGPFTDDSGRSIAGLLDIDMECLQRAFEVMDAYLLLDGTSVLQSYSQTILEACESYLEEVKPECMKPVLTVVGRVVQLYPEEGPQLIRPCLDKMMNKVFGTEEGYPRVTCAYLLIVARIMFQNFPYFLQYLQELAASSGQNVADLFAVLLEIWSDKLDVMVELEQRKMTGLAMACLLSVRDQCVTARFGTLLNMCIEVLHDIVDTNYPDSEGSMYDTLCKAHEKRLKQQKEDDLNYKSEQDLRIYAAESHDPLYILSLHEYVASQLQAAQTIYGEAEYAALIANVDPLVLEQLSEFVPQITTSLAHLQQSLSL